MQTTRARPGSSAASLLASALPFAAALFSGGACAADAAGPDASSGALEEIVVTATRREENLRDVPFSATALRGDDLEALGDSGQDVKQLAFKVPSLNVESSNGRAFPRFYIRGYGNTDFHDFASQPVGLVYDDIVQENAALKGFPIFDQQDVEVLRGPQGTLFGRNSPAGVVKFESAKPKIGEFSGYFNFSDATYNSAVAQGAVNVPISDSMAFRAAVQGQRRDAWVSDPISNSNLGGYDDWAARLQLLINPSDSLSVLLNVHGRTLSGSSTLFRANIIEYGTNQLIQPLPSGAVAAFDPARIYTDGPNSSALTTVGANVHVTWKLPALTLQSITGYESVTHYLAEGDIDGGYGPGFFSGSALPSGPGAIPFPVETSAGLSSHEQLTQEFRAISAGDGPLQGQAGVFIFYEDATAADDDYCTPPGFGAATCGATYWTLQDTTIDRQRNDAEAVFGSLEYTVLPPLKLRAGVRYTADHKKFVVLYSDVVPPPTAPLAGSANASNVSWDASATWGLSSDVNLYARVATGFRAPSFGVPAAGLPIQVARSEDDISYETGVKAELPELRSRVSFDVYYYDVSHPQLTAVGGAANVTQLINAAHATGQGAELEFETHPLSAVTFDLSGSLNDTKIRDKTLAVAPCFNWGPGDACTVLNPLNAAGNALINGNPLPQAAKWVVDASLRYEFPLGDAGKLYAYTDWSYRSAINFGLYSSVEFTGPPLTEGGLRLGYTWASGKYDVAAFCRNCTNQIRAIGAIDFENTTGYINDPRIVGGQIRVKF